MPLPALLIVVGAGAAVAAGFWQQRRYLNALAADERTPFTETARVPVPMSSHLFGKALRATINGRDVYLVLGRTTRMFIAIDARLSEAHLRDGFRGPTTTGSVPTGVVDRWRLLARQTGSLPRIDVGEGWLASPVVEDLGHPMSHLQQVRRLVEFAEYWEQQYVPPREPDPVDRDGNPMWQQPPGMPVPDTSSQQSWQQPGASDPDWR